MRARASYSGEGAVVGVVTGKQSSILNEHRHSFQDEGNEELDVNIVPGTTQSPVEKPHNTYVTFIMDVSCRKKTIYGSSTAESTSII